MESSKVTADNALTSSDCGTMSFESSFTLCPSNGGAFATYGDSHGKGEESAAASEKKTQEGDPPTTATNSPLIKLKPRVEQRVLPGTLLNAFALPQQISTTKSIRALPFEPLVHNRNLPKNGTISPLQVHEHGSSVVVHTTHPPHRIPSAVSTTTKAPSPSEKAAVELSPNSRAPPVAEIRIPTPLAGKDGSSDAEADVDSCASNQDFKTLFLCCQHKLHEEKDKAAVAAEENRMLKRHLIQLQKQLNVFRRNKRVSSTTSWTIPVSRPGKRQCCK